eukprot:4673496-Prymnesium_polylepis.1
MVHVADQLSGRGVGCLQYAKYAKYTHYVAQRHRKSKRLNVNNRRRRPRAGHARVSRRILQQIRHVEHLELRIHDTHRARHVRIHVHQPPAMRQQQRVAQHVERVLKPGGRVVWRADVRLV